MGTLPVAYNSSLSSTARAVMDSIAESISPRVLSLLLFLAAYMFHSEMCFAQAQIVDHFRPITIEEAPPELRQEIENAQDGSRHDLRLKIAGISNDAVGFDLAVIRIEGDDCNEKFCPTYVKYSFKQGTPAVQTLTLKCEEWLMIGDNFPLISSANDVVGVGAWIVVRLNAGESLVTFTRIGPALSIEKVPR